MLKVLKAGAACFGIVFGDRFPSQCLTQKFNRGAAFAYVSPIRQDTDDANGAEPAGLSCADVPGIDIDCVRGNG
jgi:hypothetical protein